MKTFKDVKYIVYRTTNIVNGKIYVGVHSTINIDDNYLGSGTAFRHAIKKYGKECFVKENLFEFDDRILAYNKEREIVDQAFVNDQMTYNLTIGGRGGEHTVESRLIISRKTSERQRGTKLSEEHRRNIGIGGKGRIVSDETREKLSLALSGRFRLPMSKETKDKISMAVSGNLNPMHIKGGHSVESKQKMSKTAKSRPLITCPKCGTTGSNNAMKQWHFDNCRIGSKNNENV